MDVLSLSLLGPFAATLGGCPIPTFRTRATQALLIYLACRPDQPQRREHLMALLWPCLPQKSAQANLRQTLYQLRQAIPEVGARDGRTSVPLVLSDWQTAQINPDAGMEVDVLTFEKLQHNGEASWRAAADLYRGDFLADFSLPDSPAFEEWVLARREEMRSRYLKTVDCLAELALARDDPATAETYARRALAVDNLHETAHVFLMQALAQAGQRVEALAHHEQLVELLHRELAVAPSAESQTLYEQIRAGELAVAPAAAKHGAIPPHNLPAQVTPFVGRAAQLDALAALLTGRDSRLITILAPGGMGKTRLALAVAERLLAHDGACPFPDGLYFVPLAAVDDPDDLPAAIAKAMSVTEMEADPAARRQQVQRILADKQLLLILDNFEQLVAGAAWLSELVETAAHLRLLVTSRACLNLHGEQLFPLAGLPYAEWPDPAAPEQSDAARLFLQAARRLRPDFALDGSTAALSDICRLVDGLPLALELAAGWVRLLPLPEIAAEIERGIDLLASEQADLPERHRSIQALLDGTWGRLNPEEQQILGRLSVFRGGFTREAAVAVAGADLRRLNALANQTLIQPQPGRDRYDLHPLLRQYARGRLSETELAAAQEAHCTYFCHWLGEMESDIWFAKTATLEAVEGDLANIRLAWQHAADYFHFACLDKAALGLFWFYEWIRREHEMEPTFMPVVRQLDKMRLDLGQQRVLAKLLACATLTAPAVDGIAAVRRALAMVEDSAGGGIDVRPDRAFILWRMYGELESTQPAKSRSCLAQSCDIYRELDNTAALAYILSQQSDAERRRCEHVLALSYAREACQLYREAGAVSCYGTLLGALGYHMILEGDVDSGWQRVAEARDVLTATGDYRRLIEFSDYVGPALWECGRLEQALEVFQEAAKVNNQLFDRSRNKGRRFFQMLFGMGISASLFFLGRYSEVHSSIQELKTTLGDDIPRDIVKWCQFEPALHRGLAYLADQNLVEAKKFLLHAEVFAVSVFGRNLLRFGQALLALAENQPNDSREYLLASLEPAVTDGIFLFITDYTFPAAAAWMIAEGHTERAVEIWNRAVQRPLVRNSIPHNDLCGRPVEEAARQLPPDVRAAAEARGRALDLRETARALLEELRAAKIVQSNTPAPAAAGAPNPTEEPS